MLTINPQNVPHHVVSQKNVYNVPVTILLIIKDAMSTRNSKRRKIPNTKSKFIHNTIKSKSNNLNVKPSYPFTTMTNHNISNSPTIYAQATSYQPPQTSPSPTPDII